MTSTREWVKNILLVLAMVLGSTLFSAPAYAEAPLAPNSRILFLHHSTGEVIWGGGVPEWFESYNATHKTAYSVTEQAFPKDSPYGWKNYPFDYWNIWVNHAGNVSFMSEPTLEMLTKEYQVIVFKHCFPVSDIEPDADKPDITSEDKTIANYKLQYNALKTKLRAFPSTRFIVWTGAAQVKGATSPEQARRAQTFFAWVNENWNENGDNIFVWDFRSLETEGGIYLKSSKAAGADDSHPASAFAKKAAPLFCQKVVDVILDKGDADSKSGK